LIAIGVLSIIGCIIGCMVCFFRSNKSTAVQNQQPIPLNHPYSIDPLYFYHQYNHRQQLNPYQFNKLYNQNMNKQFLNIDDYPINNPTNTKTNETDNNDNNDTIKL
jgi:hypothetical protein